MSYRVSQETSDVISFILRASMFPELGALLLICGTEIEKASQEWQSHFALEGPRTEALDPPDWTRPALQAAVEGR